MDKEDMYVTAYVRDEMTRNFHESVDFNISSNPPRVVKYGEVLIVIH